MDVDQMIMILAVCMAAYFAGYTQLALGIGVLVVLIYGARKIRLRKPAPVSPAGGVKVRGAETLEPIYIETSKGAPFRIPERMDIRVNPSWSARPVFEKAMYKGLGSLGRMGYRAVRGGEYE